MSDDQGSRHNRWARFRFSVVGPLLAAPPARGELRAELERLAQKRWRHPITGEPVSLPVSTIERWYYAARNERRDPVAVLRRRVRKDAGRQPSFPAELRQALHVQHKAHPSWSYQLHADNLAALVEQEACLGAMPSYSTVRRYMKAHGLFRRRGGTRRDTPGAMRAAARLEQREVRSFEAEYVHGLWHLDFHAGSRQVLTRTGAWQTPQLLGVLDDRSRLACHVQWYLDETAQTLVHGLGQAIQKRGLPRALLTDNGSAMVAAETQQGLLDLGVVSDFTLPYSAYQNAKQEVFWAQVEGRLMAMLEGCEEPTLDFLNEATQAWVELEYNHRRHAELSTSPLERYLAGPDVGRASPSSEALRRAFRRRVGRTQRRSDGTISLEGRRFEVPSRYRHLERVWVRYARWDLSAVDLVDARTGAILCALYPLDKTKNADGLRRRLDPVSPDAAASDAVASPADEIAPLLRKLMADYAATGLPPAYLPQDVAKDEEDSR
ncbi:MAG: DDE-type integrase/transposase/recombinase [Planctomycetota bacterium]|jgi:transposase InsO family protein